MIESDADRAALLADDPTSGTLAGQPVTGLFQRPYIREPFGGPGAASASTSAPSFWLPTTDVPASVVDAQLVIPAGPFAGTYVVREHQPDGWGGSLLIL